MKQEINQNENQAEVIEQNEYIGEATYCPEDDKLRLYVGRVPRDMYERLRSEGWTSTPKQECNFVAVWTTQREDTALELCGEIGDEDQSPTDRAADRAERFAGYQDRRLNEACEKADAYEAAPMIHGHQSAALAERRAARHDRIGDCAVTLWNKAEYWQRRTEGVIAHALHVSAPGVRMGRIKTLEAEKRRVEAQYTPEDDTVRDWEGVPIVICGQGRDRHGVAVDKLEKIKASYARYLNHIVLRLAYENQMLEAQGGRAGAVDMVPGGWIGERQIMKVNKSTTSGRVVSVAVKVPRINEWQHKTENVPGTDYAVMTFEVERLTKEIYRAPTAEELEAFEAAKKSDKKKKADATPKAPPLINPTIEDAERLQAVWNAQKIAHEPKKVLLLTQEQYTAACKNYSKPETKEITGGGFRMNSHYNAVNFPAVAKVRACYGSVIVLTDKPQKPLTAEMWHDPRPALLSDVAARIDDVYRLTRQSWLDFDKMSEDEKNLFTNARLVGLAYYSSMSQYGLTEKGAAVLESRKAGVA